MRQTTTAEVRLDQGGAAVSALRGGQSDGLAADRIFLRRRLDATENHARGIGKAGNVG